MYSQLNENISDMVVQLDGLSLHTADRVTSLSGKTYSGSEGCAILENLVSIQFQVKTGPVLPILVPIPILFTQKSSLSILCRGEQRYEVPVPVQNPSHHRF